MKAENAGRALALCLVDELARCGVAHACLAPGSRSAPLAIALAEEPRIRLHVAIDERSAAFCALGIAKAGGRAAVAVSTSGTAAANFLPAVVEARHSRTPLIALTADRPPELRDTGANQTIDQIKLYGDAAVWFCEVGAPEARPEAVRYWRSVASRAFAAATGPLPGPVHLNLALRDPVVPLPDERGFPFALGGRPGGEPWTRVTRSARPPRNEDVERLAAEVAAAERGLVVAGGFPVDPQAVAALARAAAWPLLADPLSGVRCRGFAISTYEALLRHPPFAESHRPDLVVRAGTPGAGRTLPAFLDAGVRQVVVGPGAEWLDPERTAAWAVDADPALTCSAVASALPGRGDSAWLASWLGAEARARAALDDLLDSWDRPAEPRVARDLAALLPDGATLVAASSMPVRDLEWFMRPRAGLRVLGNRGASGIDGFVSTATGVALAGPGPVAALAGDLSLLHDQNGLLLARRERVDLAIVAVNNDGGGIFSFLPQAGFPDHFEEVFGTPHGADLAALAAAHGCGYLQVEEPSAFEGAVENALGSGGVQMIEVPTDRAANVDDHRQAWEAVARALGG